jgi:hypothetical protein
MAALVEECLDRAVLLAHDDDRVFAHVGVEEVARLRNLAFVREKQPAAPENALHFEFVDCGVGVDCRCHASVAGIHERVDVEFGGGHPCLLRGITHSISVSTRCMILVRACAVKYFVCRF